MIAVPQSVARGMVRAGSATLPAGTVADSSPSSAHRVSAAVAPTAPGEKPPASGWTGRAPPPSIAAATISTAASGSSLRTVVTSWSLATAPVRQQLSAVNSHTAATASKAGSPATPAMPGAKRLR